MGREQGLSLKQVPECSRNLYFIHEGQLITVKSLSQYPIGRSRIWLSDRYSFINLWFERNEKEQRISIFGNGRLKAWDQTQPQTSLDLQNLEAFEIEFGSIRLQVLLIEDAEDTVLMKNFLLPRTGQIHIGRMSENDIQIDNPLVSRLHATIDLSSEGMHLRDEHSSFGTRVNGEFVSLRSLQAGDRLEFPGCLIVVGLGFLSIQSLTEHTVVRSLTPLTDPIQLKEWSSLPKPRESIPFFRKPRERAFHFDPVKITVDLPPLSMSANKIPLLLRLGGPAVLSGMSALNGNFTSLISSVMFPMLTSKFTEKERKEYENRRYVRYNEYLSEIQNQIETVQAMELQDLNENNPSEDDLFRFLPSRRRLWERRPVHQDFLRLRIGKGKVPLKSEIQYPSRLFGVDEDSLALKMYGLVEQDYALTDAPITVDFIEDYICGVRGSLQRKLSLFYRLLFQICYLHASEELKIILVMDRDMLEENPFLKFLPHIWDDRQEFRWIITSEADAAEASKRLSERVEEAQRKEGRREQVLENPPYYLVFSFSQELLESAKSLWTAVTAGHNLGFSIFGFSTILPKECTKVFSLEEGGIHILQLEHQEKPDLFCLDASISRNALMKAFSEISNIRRPKEKKEEELPAMLTFLEMYKAGRIEHLDIEQRWKDSNPMKTLAAPVGVHPDGSLFELDIHEKKHGPHGLIAGMTGSGKSEFIISYVLSLAVNYHPYEVSFILIDFKGGGLTGAFVDPQRGIKLPHVAGTITNLDESTMNRALASIESELKRRQKIFNEAKSIANEGTMDIYGYQQLYRRGVVSEPVSHLLIISDEFAELNDQHPEFLDQLVSTARIGRSLGVHLILATQKPAGVVTGQIKSNTKFRVSLKVQDRSDSNDMINRPYAAEIKETGRFYMLVGYDEYFAMGQSAWTGAEYKPSDEAQSSENKEILFLDPNGEPYFKTKPIQTRRQKGRSQLVSLVTYLSDLARQKGIEVPSLWLDPLNPQISLSSLKQPEDSYSVTIGLTDDPENQEQLPYTLDLANAGNILIAGEPGTGKTWLAETILLTSIDRNSPEDLQFYIADLTGKSLGMFSQLKHVGMCMSRPSEEELCLLIQFAYDLLEKRKKLFAQYNRTSFASMRRVQRLPLTFFIIDGFDDFPDRGQGRQALDQLLRLLRDGPAFGIQFMLLVADVRNVTARQQSVIQTSLPLRLTDMYLYQDLLDIRPKAFPDPLPGRGYIRKDKRVLEFQAAALDPQLDDAERYGQILSQIETANTIWKDAAEPDHLTQIDPEQTYEEFIAPFKPERIPLGIIRSRLRPIALPFQQLSTLPVYFGNPDAVNYVMGAIQTAVKKSGGSVIRLSASELPKTHREGIEWTKLTAQTVNTFVNQLAKIAKERKTIRLEIQKEKGIEDWKEAASLKIVRKEMRRRTEPLFILVDDYGDLILNLSAGSAGPLSGIINNTAGFNIYFVFGWHPQDKERISLASRKLHETEKSKLDEGNLTLEEVEELRRFTLANDPERFDAMMKSHFKGKLTLLFGGCFDRQDLVTLPREYSRIVRPSKTQNLNNGLIWENDQVETIFLPLGDLRKTAQEDEDERPVLS